MPKKPKRTTLRNKADRLFSRIVRARGICERCGKTNIEHLQCAHIVPRGYLKVRWDEDNALCLCSGCHVYFTHHPLEWEAFIEGLSKIDYPALRERALDVDGPKVDYEAVIERLERRLDEMR